MEHMPLQLLHPLPGRDAQREMSPEHSLPFLLCEVPKQAVHASVLLLLTPANAGRSLSELMDWEILLIRRNTYPGVHSGQIALPGGRRDPGDADLWETACRETLEEVGIRKNEYQRIGQLTSLYIGPSNYLVHPFVAVCQGLEGVCANPREVVDYKTIPIRAFDPARGVWRGFRYHDGIIRQAPAWDYEDYVIWGATAMILAEFYRAASVKD